MTRLRLDAVDPRPLEDWARDGAIALFTGLSITMLLFRVLEEPLNQVLPDFFDAASLPLAHGHNVVNVILVDFRGLDTLGEISVVFAAGLSVLALLRGVRLRTQSGPEPEATSDQPPRPRRARPRREAAS
jgi:multicomponent Na+:H+ antiporter subunit A